MSTHAILIRADGTCRVTLLAFADGYEWLGERDTMLGPLTQLPYRGSLRLCDRRLRRVPGPIVPTFVEVGM